MIDLASFFDAIPGPSAMVGLHLSFVATHIVTTTGHPKGFQPAVGPKRYVTST